MRWLLILALCLPVSATTYYMRADGSAANKAAATSCSAASTAMSVATHNSQTYSAGDIITLCDNGGTFRGIVTPPSSGSAGNLISYVNSGSPVISGADVISGFSGSGGGTPTFGSCWGANDAGASATTITVAVTPTGGSGHILVGVGRNDTTGSATITLSDNSGSNTWNAAGSQSSGSSVSEQMWYVQNPAAGSYTVTATFSPSTTNRGVAVCEYSGMATSTVLDGTPTTGTCGSVTSCTSSSFNTTNASDLVIMASTTNASALTITAGAFGGNTGTTRTTNSNIVYWGDTNFAAAQTGITANQSYTGTAHNWAYTVAAFKAAAASNIWDATVTTQPKVVVFNGTTLGTLVASRAAITAANQWYWTGTTLSVYGTSDPSGTIEAGQRTYAFDANNKSYLSVSNLTLYGANSVGIYVRGSSNSAFTGNASKWNKDAGWLIRSTDSTVFTSDDSQYNYNSNNQGFQADSADSNLTFTNCTASHNLGDGLMLNGVTTATVNGGEFQLNGTASAEGNGIDILQESSGTPSTNITLNNVVSHDNLGNGLDVISVTLGDSGNTVTVNGGQFYNNTTGAAPASGVRFDDNTHDSTVKYVQSYGNSSGGIVVEASATNNAILYNQVWGNNNGITQSNAPGAGNVFYGNVSYANTLDGFQVQTGGVAATVKNNIWFSNGRYGFNTDGSVTDVVDYNVSFGNVTANYNGISQPAHDVVSDPLFTNASGHDFTLTSSSPAINAGTNLGSTYQLALAPESAWPNAINTLNQNTYGTGWEIGAFVFIPFPAGAVIDVNGGITLSGGTSIR